MSPTEVHTPTTSLFTGFDFRSLKLRNRFVMAPMTRMKSPDGIPNEAVVEYYARRAKAEVGLIITEGTVINRVASKNAKDIPNIYGPALEGWAKVVKVVHANGGAIAAQIWHVGAVKSSDPTGWVPAEPFEGPDTMSVQDIETTIAAYAQAALDAKTVGFDAIELHGAHGYLIDQFFYDGMNHRNDIYGGTTITARNRFALDVIKAVRAAVGPEYPVILRLSQWKQQDYTAKIARTPEEMEEWLLPLSEAGVDIFHCSNRRFWESEFEGSDLNFAGWAKKITGKPTITVGSVGLEGEFIASFGGESTTTSDLSELVRRFDRGDFDLVAVGRALLQDPEWVLKVKDGRESELHSFAPSAFAKYF